jgi:hypothetical protein
MNVFLGIFLRKFEIVSITSSSQSIKSFDRIIPISSKYEFNFAVSFILAGLVISSHTSSKGFTDTLVLDLIGDGFDEVYL